MGPIILFDKSFLQSLRLDEAVFFDHFFYPNICSIFFVETLADLDKVARRGRTPEEEVGIIADKTPEMNGMINAFHGQMCVADLLGYSIPMTGQVMVPRGRPVRYGNQSGMVFEEDPEVQAFRRWQEGKFMEVEHSFARIWREMLSLADFDKLARALRGLGLRPGRCKRLEDAKNIADAMIITRNNSNDRIRLTFWLLGVPKQFQKDILLRWTLDEQPPLVEFAPYASFVLSVKIFFQIARATNLMSKKPSTVMDISYLFYLPFCMVFTSSDRLHERSAPLFLRPDQEFISGRDLKADLIRIVDHFDAVPEDEKEKGLYGFAEKPPVEGNFLIASLWDRYLPNWHNISTAPVNRDLKEDEYLVKHPNAFAKAPRLNPEEIDFDLQNPDAVTLERKVGQRRGKWWQLPKDLKIDEQI
jgi:hypothetical protein